VRGCVGEFRLYLTGPVQLLYDFELLMFAILRREGPAQEENLPWCLPGCHMHAAAPTSEVAHSEDYCSAPSLEGACTACLRRTPRAAPPHWLR
jgi:hypothetical protein